MTDPHPHDGHDPGPQLPACPWCGAADTERLSAVGPTHMTEQWFCPTCHSPFERVRRRTPGPPRSPDGPG